MGACEERGLKEPKDDKNRQASRPLGEKKQLSTEFTRIETHG